MKQFEKNYGIVELESKAIEWAIQKCRHYLLGCPSFQVNTDHKPLVALYDKPLDDVPNTRVQQHREMLARFCFRVQWEAGKRHLIVDALSRYHVFAPDEDPEEGHKVLEVIRVARNVDPKLEELRQT